MYFAIYISQWFHWIGYAVCPVSFLPSDLECPVMASGGDEIDKKKL